MAATVRVCEGGKAYSYQGNGMQNFKTTFYFSYAFFRSSELSFLYKVMIKCFSFIHFRKKIIDTKQKRKKKDPNIYIYIYIVYLKRSLKFHDVFDYKFVSCYHNNHQV